MAKRVGKYKIGSKESKLSLADGGTIDGALTVAGADITFSGFVKTPLRGFCLYVTFSYCGRKSYYRLSPYQ